MHIQLTAIGQNRRSAYLFALIIAVLAIYLATAGFSYAKYAGYNAKEPYLAWDKANTLYKSLNSTTSEQDSPHGGYTQTSFKCTVCHSVHRAASERTELGVGSDQSLLASAAGDSCTACHAAWGANLGATLIEVGQHSPGPHLAAGEGSCAASKCHGSVHGAGPTSKYAIVEKYNLTNSYVPEEGDNTPPEVHGLEAQMDRAIAAGNVNANISTNSTSQEMKAFATGFVCYPCHGASSRSVAVAGVSTSGSAAPSSFLTGHVSTTSILPSCDTCHDMVGVATGTTAWPHGNRGIEVYLGRYDGRQVHTSVKAIPTNALGEPVGLDEVRYGLWMTATKFNDHKNAVPLVGAVADAKEDFKAESGSQSKANQNIDLMLTDGVCIKCHKPGGLR